MAELQFEIVCLAPMRVASFHGFGAEPEGLAAGQLLAWAAPRGLLDDGMQRRVFGFNNPSPSAGSPNYGYEFWLELPETDGAGTNGRSDTGRGDTGRSDTGRGDAGRGEPEIKVFDGGLYAVARCRGVEAVPHTWRALVTALEDSRYAMGRGQCLEQHTGALDADPQALEFALYQPILPGATLTGATATTDGATLTGATATTDDATTGDATTGA